MNISLLNHSNCGNYSQAEEDLIETCRYWMEGILMAAVGAFGLIGNSFSIYILSTEDMKNSFNHLLIVLACFDNLFLVFCVMDYSIAGVFQWPFSETGEFYAMIFPKFLYPVNHITLRYCAVCHPYTYRDLTHARTVGKRVTTYVVPVLTFSVILNIPKFFETKLVTSKEVSDLSLFAKSNLTVAEMLDLLNRSVSDKITFETSDLRDNPEYIRYYINYCRLLITCVIPLIALIFFNFRIFRGIRYTHLRAGKTGRREANLALVLVCIVVVFVLCHIPRCKSQLLKPPWNLCVMSLNHLLLVLNASVNFLIYCSIGKKFKDVIRKIFFGKEIPAVRVCSEKCGSGRREAVALVPRDQDRAKVASMSHMSQLTPMEEILPQSPSSAHPTATTCLSLSVSP